MSPSPQPKVHFSGGLRPRSHSGLAHAAVGFAGSLICIFCLSGAFAQQLDLEPSTRAVKATPRHTVERYVPPGFLRQAPEQGSPAESSGSSPHGSVGVSASESISHSIGSAPATGVMPYSGGPPLTATVTHTLYLPPAMYGQWNVTGTLMETNAPDLFSPTVSDIWLLEREGNQVTVTNPVNGAYATISVDRAEGDRATFHRTGTAGRHSIFQETPTITVNGDRFSGQSFNRVQNIRNGQVTQELYGIYHLEATRISAARTRFRPEAEQQDPDLQIEEVH